MNTNEKGNIGLAKVIAELTENEYYCFLPFTDTTCVDLIVCNKDMKTLRVQVKHKKIRNGCIAIKCASVINGKTIILDKSKIDYFIVYCPDNKQIYYLPISLFGDGYTISLRVNKPKMVYKTMKLANEFSELKF